MAKVILRSPIGPILIDCDGHVLRSIHIPGSGEALPDGYGAALPGSPAAEAARQLSAYFDTGFTAFMLPLAPSASARGEALRQAIVAIPPGETQSYGELARRIGSAPRAVGQACRRNPFPIVVPCHRVVGSGGTVGYYSAGAGIMTKSWLLDHERRGGLL